MDHSANGAAAALITSMYWSRFALVSKTDAGSWAMASNPADARVSLTDVIRTLRETAEDMSDRYKETSQGGLAVNVSVRVPEC